MKNRGAAQRTDGRGGRWVLGQAVLLLGVLLGGMNWRHQWSGWCAGLMGTVLLAAAAICGIAGALALGRNLTPFPQPVRDAQLVQSGIYALMRHPLYTAVFSGSIGWALVWGSWPSLAAALLLAPFFDAKARVEERALRKRFPEYKQYEAQVKRFIPWLY